MIMKMDSGLKIGERSIEYLGFWKIVGNWIDGRYVVSFKECKVNNEGLLG